MSVPRSVVLGCGSYLPDRVVSNCDLSRMVDTSDEWILQRTGIRERRIAANGETTVTIGLAAARAALAAAPIAGSGWRHQRAPALATPAGLGSEQRGPCA